MHNNVVYNTVVSTHAVRLVESYPFGFYNRKHLYKLECFPHTYKTMCTCDFTNRPVFIFSQNC